MCETIDAAEHPERALALKAQRSRAGDTGLPRSDAPVCLDLRAASVEFRGRIALAEASLTIARGEAVAILGPSGAGKTTLLRLLGASLKPVRGEVVANGSPLHTFSPRELKRLRARIGFVHQNHDLVPNLRVIQNVLSGRLGRYGFLGSLREVFVPPKSSVRRIHEILERVGIPGKLYERTLVRIEEGPMIAPLLAQLSEKYLGGSEVPPESVTSGYLWIFELAPRQG